MWRPLLICSSEPECSFSVNKETIMQFHQKNIRLQNNIGVQIQKIQEFASEIKSLKAKEIKLTKDISSKDSEIDHLRGKKAELTKEIEALKKGSKMEALYSEMELFKAKKVQLVEEMDLKGYDVSIVPEWCYHELSSLQYEILPVYRTIKHFHKHKLNDEELYTDPFYTSNGGYKVTLCVYPNGAGSGKGTHVSVFINLMKGPNDDNLPFPINGIFTVQMLNWKEDHHHIEKSIVFDDNIPIEHRERVTRGVRADGMGYGQFLSHNDVASMNVLYEDIMCFKISYTPIIQTGCSPLPSWCDAMYSTLYKNPVQLH